HAMVELRAERTQPARIVARQSHEIAVLLVELEHPRDRIGQEAEHVELVADDRQRTRTWKRDLREIEEHRHGNGRYETYPPRSDKMDDITIKATASRSAPQCLPTPTRSSTRRSSTASPRQTPP